jgi:hypothetical protein
MELTIPLKYQKDIEVVINLLKHEGVNQFICLAP